MGPALRKPLGVLIGENIAALAIVLLAFGFFMVLDATAVSRNLKDASSFHAAKQLSWDLIGLTAFAAITMLLPLPWVRRAAPALALFGLLLLLGVLLLGQEINGARRWFRFGFLSFQPSEFAKIAYVLWFARFLEERRHLLHSIPRGVLPVLALMLLPTLLIAREPDLGNAALLFFVLCGMAFVAGVRLAHLLIPLLCLLPPVVFLLLRFTHFKDRINAFLDPSGDVGGKGYQVQQALIALGSGGPLGKGPGQGLQKMFYLPEAHNDFIFAIIGEDLGLIGCSLAIFLYGFIVWNAVRICRLAPDLFSLTASFGLTCLFAGQAIINMAVVTNLFPNKGIALPLISYGGSNTLFSLASLGVLARIAQALPADRPLELGAVRLEVRQGPLF